MQPSFITTTTDPGGHLHSRGALFPEGKERKVMQNSKYQKQEFFLVGTIKSTLKVPA